MTNNQHMRSIQGRLSDAEAEIERLTEAVTHLTGVIEAKDAVIADYERQLAKIRQTARIRIANGHANGNGTA